MVHRKNISHSPEITKKFPNRKEKKGRMGQNGLTTNLTFITLIICIIGSINATPMCKECEKLANDLLRTVDNTTDTYEWLDAELQKICEGVLSSNPVLLRECKKLASDVASQISYVGVFRTYSLT